MSCAVGFRSRVVVLVLVLACGAERRAGAESMVTPVAPMPVSIQLSMDLLARVEAMRQQSPTFRQQFERILGASRLVLTGRIDYGLSSQQAFRARSTIRRYDSGLLVVSVDIGPGTNQTEWIAHEFEHVLEQLEGLDLAARADRHERGAWYSGGGMIETTRATRTGRAVRDEMQEHHRRSDKFVE